ncbi:MAG: helix-turn-helix domain-containing protein [Marinilabiliaceae bacterium]|nr:helix-turn-helix domain-containing protein [Marinilabiliaceae bacterium]
MSSNIEVKRICQHCSKEFTARTTVTKYCSDKCSKAAYKARKRAEKVNRSNTETTRIKQQPIEDIKAKDYLNVNEVCKLIGISRRTVYRLIEQGDIKKIKIGSRTLIKRSALNRLLENKETRKPEIPEQQKQDLNDWKQAGNFDINDCYTLIEVQQKYNISESAVQQIIKRNNIPKIKKGWYAYVPKTIIDSLLT